MPRLRTTATLLGVLAMVALLGTSSAVASKSKYHHPVLQSFAFGCNVKGEIRGSTLDLCIGLNNQAGFFYNPPKSGITMKVMLYLPAGVKVVKNGFTLSPRGLPASYKPAASSLRIRLVKDSKGVMRPLWQYRHLERPPIPAWHFSLKVPANRETLCIGATATPVGLRGAPIQTAKGCFARKM